MLQKRSLSKEDGFSSISALIIIMAISLLSMSLFVVVKTSTIRIDKYQKRMEEEKNIETFIDDFINDFQVLLKDKADIQNANAKRELLDKYKEYNLTLDDVSTGICEELMNDSFLKSSEISNLLFLYKNDVRAEYGYLNYNYAKKELLETIIKDYDAKSVDEAFPSVNSFPMYNIYNMKFDFISAILKKCGIKDYDNKTKEIFEKTNSNILLSTTDIRTLLGVNDNSSVLDFLGVKTLFWKATMLVDKKHVELVVAGIPVQDREKKEAEKSLEKYVLVKQSYGNNVEDKV